MKRTKEIKAQIDELTREINYYGERILNQRISLRAETRQSERLKMARREAKRERLQAELAELGINTETICSDPIVCLGCLNETSVPSAYDTSICLNCAIKRQISKGRS